MSDPSRLSLPVVSPGPSTDAHGCRPADPHTEEFARGASAWNAAFSRRDFLARSAAAMALAGVVGCSDHPDEAIVPYVDPPEQVVAGEPQFFATTLTRGGYGRGVIVTSREGRPVKIEGNPDHPASLGAADAVMQASVLDLYDPLRSSSVTQAGVTSTWGAFVTALTRQLETHRAGDGQGLLILTGATSSPTLAGLYEQLRGRFPNAWHQHESLGRWDAIGATGAALPGRRREATYDFSACDVIVSFDSDFLIEEPGSLAYARQFAAARRPTAERMTMNRLYVAEADFSVTGTRADHRLAVRPSRVGALVAALAAQVGMDGAAVPTDLTSGEAAWLSAIASDLHAHRGRCLVLAGPRQSVAMQATALAITRFLGGLGRTLRPVAPVLLGDFDPGSGNPTGESPTARPGALTNAFDRGVVRTVLILADNPVRTAFADHPLAERLATLSRRADAFTAHVGLYANETAFNCQWHVPAAHELESWGDARAFDGTASLLQPLIAPQTQGRSPIDLFNLLLGRPEKSAYDTVREHWQQARGLSGPAFEAWWTDTLRRGVIDREADEKLPTVDEDDPAPSARVPVFADDDTAAAPAGLEVVLRPDASIGDGAQFHNPWLQELPRPMTKIVWGNAAIVSPATAARHGVVDDAVVKLEAGGRSVEAPVLTLPGVADDVVVLHLGYGEHKVVASDTNSMSPNEPFGVDAYPLRTSASPGFVADVTLAATGRTRHVVRTHNHHSMAAEVSADPSVKPSLTPHVVATPDTSHEDLELHNRKLIRTATLAQFAATPGFAATMDKGPIEQLYPAWDYSTGPQWGMTIDLTACIGCNACITACQAENNTPTVGPEQVDAGREMHWLRVDSYVDEKQQVHHQPVPCMHCENAPCEYVCPVAATTHSVEGLNQMTYNRCVGTRYCSNNCPYKVRRFNFFNYTFYQPEPYKMQRNPDVTVRTRGVMEKCTYCVQRINYADRKTEIAAVNAGGEATDAAGSDKSCLRREMFGRLQVACQQTCPTDAIHFGDLTNPDASVTKDKKGPRNYGILVELTTKPRTTYLASITNPNPGLRDATNTNAAAGAAGSSRVRSRTIEAPAASAAAFGPSVTSELEIESVLGSGLV